MSIQFVRMNVSFLFKIKYATPNLINSYPASRKYSYETAGHIQLTSRKDAVQWQLDKIELINPFPKSIVYEHLNSSNIMHTH